MRALIIGWPSFLHGEATAGDVLSMRHVQRTLTGAGIPCDSAWSPGFRPGELTLDDADPAHYTHVIFTCGPAHGEQVREIHHRFPQCRRFAVGVSVLDREDEAVTGFHHVIPRDDAQMSTVDLSAAAEVHEVPVTGVTLAPGQHEYGARRRHDDVHKRLLRWLNETDTAAIPLDTRLDGADWRHCATPDQFVSLLGRLDVLVTTRLHGLVLALRCGVPVLAVDPVAEGGKVTKQARAWNWPALVGAEEDQAAFERWWRWCLSPSATQRARASSGTEPMTARLVQLFQGERA